MVGNLPEAPRILLDACCLINLLATGRLEEILRTLPYEFATSRFIVENEVISLSMHADSGSPLKREVIPLARLERIDSLAILEISTEKGRAEFVRFAEMMDDGEASVCALAVTQSGVVATDDRKALRDLSRMAPDMPTVQTPELLYEWARLSRAPDHEISTMLRAVRQRARFFPRQDAPRFEWWNRLFSVT